MVRSSGHHRKRSRSRSASPDHKRSKSSREHEKDRVRRRSRSRDRSRRSRSRDRKKEKRDSESRFRSKPLKLKHRSRSRSRSGSKSKEKGTKKDDKKEVKVDDEPFDPTNLDKVLDRDDDEEWVVTDVIEEATELDNGTLEEEYDYEADEDDQYSHSSRSQPNSPDSRHKTADQENNISTEVEISSSIQDVDKAGTEINQENGDVPKQISDEVPNQNSTTVHDETDKNVEKGEKAENASDNVKKRIEKVVKKIKESSSNHRTRTKSISKKYEADRTRRRTPVSYNRSYSSRSEDITSLSKDHIRQCIKHDKELHDLRLKHEIARHTAELQVLKLQLDYWNGKINSAKQE